MRGKATAAESGAAINRKGKSKSSANKTEKILKIIKLVAAQKVDIAFRRDYTI